MENYNLGELIEKLNVLEKEHPIIFIVLGIFLGLLLFLSAEKAGESIGKFLYYLKN